MKIYQILQTNATWSEVPEEIYAKASTISRRILDTDCAKFKWYEFISGSFERALALFNTNSDFICDKDTPFYHPRALLETTGSPVFGRLKKMCYLANSFEAALEKITRINQGARGTPTEFELAVTIAKEALQDCMYDKLTYD